MHFAAKNLLYQMHQSLDTQHVTVGFFKRYAQSPETRTFKNYFRRSRSIFSTYMHKRPQYSLSRYITLHRRKKNPILCNFTTHIKTTILSTLQHLQQHYTICEPLCSLWQSKKTQNKPISKTLENSITPYLLRPNASSLKPVLEKNKPIQTQKLSPCQGGVLRRREGVCNLRAPPLEHSCATHNVCPK